MAACALEVESVDLYPKVVDVLAGFLTHVELCSNVQEIATGVTADTHGQHHSHTVLLSCSPRNFGEFGWIEIGWIILYEYFTLCHYINNNC